MLWPFLTFGALPQYKALSHDGTEQALPDPQPNAASAGMPAAARPPTDKLHEYTDADGQRVIVVEYPKVSSARGSMILSGKVGSGVVQASCVVGDLQSPSIPSLMLAVQEMFGALRNSDSVGDLAVEHTRALHWSCVFTIG